jgi:monoterpene epsilon-lactone hydrolase
LLLYESLQFIKKNAFCGLNVMASWQSYIADPILRVRVKRKIAKAKTVEDARSIFTRQMPPPSGVVFSSDSIGGVSGEWAKSQTTSIGGMLYLHGGGYFTGSPKTHKAISGTYAQNGLEVFSADYRLAPEYPFPAAIDDALAAYKGLIDFGFSPEKLIIAGDSAGGGLALATLLMAKSLGLPMPSCAILFSPWTDLAATGDSLKINRRRDPMLVSSSMIDGANLYLNGCDPRNPLASPLYGDFTGLPPLLIQVGKGEILRDDSTRLAVLAREAGVKVDISIWPNMPHVFQVSQMFLPEAKVAMKQAADFAKLNLAA